MNLHCFIGADRAGDSLQFGTGGKAELGCATVDFELARGNDVARSFYEALNATVCDVIQPLRLPT